MLMRVHMRTPMNALRMLIRVLGTLLLVLGLLFWSGNALALLPLPVLGGMLLVLSLWSLAIALRWGVVVPILGMTRDALLPGDAHWVIKVLHLLAGIMAISLASFSPAAVWRDYPCVNSPACSSAIDEDEHPGNNANNRQQQTAIRYPQVQER